MQKFTLSQESKLWTQDALILMSAVYGLKEISGFPRVLGSVFECSLVAETLNRALSLL